MAIVLEARGVTVRFGGLTAVNGLDLSVEAGQVHGLIGPNGSGKTTMFNTISGFCRPSAGRIAFRGHDVTGLRPDRVAAYGLARTFQNIKLFHQMTVEENLLVGRHARTRAGLASALLRTRAANQEEDAARLRAAEVLQSIGLPHRRADLAGNLSYGEQRRIELGRALAMDPALIMLDEPTAGLNDRETADFVTLIRELRARGFTLLLVEHDMRVVMGVCDRVTVLDHGEKIAEGAPADVQANDKVVAAYLGTGSGGVAARKREMARARG